ncbi:hypothetical protein, conserved [Babesia ovata]|uniref:Extracellular matrix-binding ebh n=1 Tax=Babesia ovata TaxID=189622 RepID=A0A2H6KJN5_9APIC|nr:uncharacterized protein BOVATA_046950 [Babesia ovata]GBE63202.1 hypothetical protein, conserved [Babesia ovata]
MSFLHGVLDGVKDDESVKKYDGYIQVDKLSTVLNTLTKSIGSGRVGLSQSVGEVMRWLGKYNDEVDSKTRGVTNGLSTLIGDYYNQVQGTEALGLETQLDVWKGTVKNIEDELNHIETYNVTKLDSTLQSHIKHKLEPVKKVVAHLSNVAENTAFRPKVEAVDRQLREREDAVTQLIDKKSRELGETVETKFDLIDENLKTISGLHTGDFKVLMQLVSTLEKDVETADQGAKALETHYNTKIVEQLEKVNGQAVRLDTENITNGLRTVFTAVSNQLDALKSQLVELCGFGNEVTRGVKDNVSGVDTELQQQITSLKQQIKSKITKYVGDTLANKIKKAIEEKTDLIAKGDGPLNNVVDGIKQYAAKFSTKETFGKEVLNEWLEDILKDRKAFQWNLNMYVSENKRNNHLSGISSGSDPKLLNPIKEHIKSALEKKVYNGSEVEFITQPNGEISDNVGKIQAACTSFATQLEKVKRDEMTFISDIVGAIGTGLGVSSGATISDGYYDGYLTNAIDTILQRLSAKSKEAAIELNWLTDEGPINLGAKVKAAITRVKDLVKDLDEQLTPTGTNTIGDDVQKELGEQATNSEVEKGLRDLLKDAAERAIEKLNAKVKHITSTQLDGTKSAIESQNNKLRKDPAGAIYRAAQDLQVQITELQELTSQVNDNAEGQISRRITFLKEQVAALKESVLKINKSIKKFDEDLNNAIETARYNAFQARHELQRQIMTAQSELTQTTEEAFTEVKKAVQAMFVKQHETDLDELKKLVSDQKDAIQHIINRDKITGGKGLLNKLHAHFVPEVKDIDTTPSSKLKDAVERLHRGINRFFPELEKQANMESHSTEINNIYKSLIKLVKQLFESEHFDHLVEKKREEFENALASFSTDTMKDAPKAVLSPLKRGLQDFVRELQKQYVNKYEGCQPITQWVTQDTEQNAEQGADQIAGQNTKLTSDGEKCASVLVTIIANIYEDLKLLRDGCAKHGPCEKKRVYLYEPSPDDVKRTENKLGVWLDHQGFTVSKEKGSHEGELRNKDECNGKHILTLLESNSLISRPFSDDEAYQGDVVELYECFAAYMTVCHLRLPQSKTYPSSVRDMLSWMAGLPYTQIYGQINKHCTELLKKEVEEAQKKSQAPDTVLKKILTTDLYYSLSSTCRTSYRLLKTICGNGRGNDQTDYPYACYFLDNSRGFHYPDSVSTLIDVLKNICSRLLRSLYFLRTRCGYDASTANGWYDCRYGKDVSAYQLPCKNASHSDAECVPKSPLQAHLTDALPGMLPHAVASVGCKSACNTCPKTSAGQPCLTPMGLWDLTTSASINKTGRNICKVLDELCKDAESPLCSLLRCLQFVSPFPPSSLPDMFSLFCNFFQCRKVDSRTDRLRYGHNADFKQYLTDETIEAAFPLHKWYHENFSNAILTNALTKLENSVDNHNESPPKDADPKTLSSTHSDLSSITFRSKCSISGICGQYMQPLCVHAYHSFSKKQAGLHLSWFVHLAWKFWELLDCFLKAFQDAQCKSYGCSSCNCGSGKHGDKEASLYPHSINTDSHLATQSNSHPQRNVICYVHSLRE